MTGGLQMSHLTFMRSGTLKVAAGLGRLELHYGTDMDEPLRVGIIGLGAERGWATAAHIPALHALSGDFELAGVANTSLASARAAAAAFGLPRAFESTAELVASPDVVVVTVKVPYHRELVSEALNAGKSVYCEWPLGNGLAEAVELARLANDRKLPGVVGTQAIASPEVEYVRKIVADGTSERFFRRRTSEPVSSGAMMCLAAMFTPWIQRMVQLCSP